MDGDNLIIYCPECQELSDFIGLRDHDGRLNKLFYCVKCGHKIHINSIPTETDGYLK